MNDPRFPELTQSQIAILKEFGRMESYAEETKVFSRGDQHYDLTVILNGAVRIEDPYNPGKIIVNHTKNQFTGDSGMLSERGSQFDAVALPGTTLLRIIPSRFKEAIAKHSDISDVLLNAFIQRQDTILKEYTGGIRLVGSGNSKETYNIRDFMDKNHIWYTFLDVDTSKEAQNLLHQFHLNEEVLPILVNSEGHVCQNPTMDQVARYSGVLVDFEDKIFDLLVIGAGPAGLAASVYAVI